jgi:hypothetical protein
MLKRKKFYVLNFEIPVWPETKLLLTLGTVYQPMGQRNNLEMKHGWVSGLCFHLVIRKIIAAFSRQKVELWILHFVPLSLYCAAFFNHILCGKKTFYS